MFFHCEASIFRNDRYSGLTQYRYIKAGFKALIYYSINKFDSGIEIIR